MHRYLRLCIHIACAAGLLAMFLVSGDKYDVLYAMDPSLPAGSIEGGASGGRMVAAGLFVAIVLAQALVAVKASRGRQRVVPVVLVLAAALLLFVA
ncbi:hypothetical protein [Acidovorax sp. NCPPB 4044]|uniref:hypothetical protein n=1 Tax=Acidovorax sp. NCPPB 4044 TaxID=2940490 RepID=UPI0023032501|nr:hypothetical protein [Acidovorax sp. NCPPB 4044]MDA8521877.1 hypothetical protein [Acidovorax sp. NCPPB 4044]